MTAVIHPNFRIKEQRKPASAARAFMVTVPQEVYDLIMNEVDQGRAKAARDVMARALEKYLELPQGAACLNSSDRS